MKPATAQGELQMRRGFAVLIVALAGVVIFRSAIAPSNLTMRHISAFGLHFSKPNDLKGFPADDLPVP
jgi:hypothetical protein